MRSRRSLVLGSIRSCCESLYSHSTFCDVHKLHLGLEASHRVLRARQLVQACRTRRRRGSWDALEPLGRGEGGDVDSMLVGYCYYAWIDAVFWMQVMAAVKVDV